MLNWLAVIAVLATMLMLFFGRRLLSLWLQGYASDAKIGMLDLILMWLKNVDARVIMRAKIMAVQARLDNVSLSEIEALYLQGGDVLRVTTAAVAATRAGLDLNWDLAAAVELAGRDILKGVQAAVTPIIISCPAAEEGADALLVAFAQDGVQLRARITVTVLIDVNRLIGNASAETVRARVGQQFLEAVGALRDYSEALRNPAHISQRIAESGLDCQTTYSIVSVDIATIEPGENVGARLQCETADSELIAALALAEGRRRLAIALQREMVALRRRNEAQVVLAEADLTTALAERLRSEGLFNAKAADLSARALDRWESEGGACKPQVPPHKAEWLHSLTGSGNANIRLLSTLVYATTATLLQS